ncbi:hypothetical protein W02_16540 [Nitrospira sp. KM1]|uniref:hypothetical protein n=1 Tax=Nitrospira sp. KM1 TaxID=1936990 RepID=UPI0013A7135E|nr:hypothetical protein [Nitrospira sp. KM1]BCA54514.1 hypothetical protein W02_16540 [Nitrospira sp. KM1]
MIARHRSGTRADVAPFALYLIAFICVVVFMDMIGVPMSLWDLTCPDDLFSLSILEAFAVVADTRVLIPFLYLVGSVMLIKPSYQPIPSRPLFHPPLGFSS